MNTAVATLPSSLSLSSGLGALCASMSFGTLLQSFPAPPTSTAVIGVLSASISTALCASSSSFGPLFAVFPTPLDPLAAVMPETLHHTFENTKLPLAHVHAEAQSSSHAILASCTTILPPILNVRGHNIPSLPRNLGSPKPSSHALVHTQSSKTSSLYITTTQSRAPRVPASPIRSVFEQPDADAYWTDLRCTLGACAFTCPSCGGSSGSHAISHSAPAHVQTFMNRANGVGHHIRPSFDRSPTLTAFKRTSTIPSSPKDLPILSTVWSLGRKMGTLSKTFLREQC